MKDGSKMDQTSEDRLAYAKDALKMMQPASKCNILMNHPSSKGKQMVVTRASNPEIFLHDLAGGRQKKLGHAADLMEGLCHALQPNSQPCLNEPWCMPILRTEAILRLSNYYIS